MIINFGKQELSKLMGGGSAYPQYMVVGTGSATVVSGTSTTLTTESSKKPINTYELGTAYKVRYIADWTSTELSGLSLKELGTTYLSGTSTGSLFNKEVFTALAFDGTQSLRGEIVFRLY